MSQKSIVTIRSHIRDCGEFIYRSADFRGRENRKIQYAILTAPLGGPVSNPTCSMRWSGGGPTTSGATAMDRYGHLMEGLDTRTADRLDELADGWSGPGAAKPTMMKPTQRPKTPLARDKNW